VLVDSNEARCKELSQQFDAFVLEGDGTHEDASVRMKELVNRA